MNQVSVTTEQKKRIENFLKGYAMNRKLLSMEKYKKAYFPDDVEDKDTPSEEPLAKARMFEVRHFILSLDNSDEKLFLYYHYVKSDSVERCAELLGISERGGYRLKNRALALAYKKKFEDAQNDSSD